MTNRPFALSDLADQAPFCQRVGIPPQLPEIEVKPVDYVSKFCGLTVEYPGLYTDRAQSAI